MAQVAVVEVVEAWRFAVQPALHAAAGDEVRRCGAVVGAAGVVLLRAASELGVGHDERAVPAICFDERGLERAEPRRELAEEALVDGSLVLVCIEAAE